MGSGCIGGILTTVVVGASVSCSACPNGTWAVGGMLNTAMACATCPMGVTCTTINGVPTALPEFGYSGQSLPNGASVGAPATGEK